MAKKSKTEYEKQYKKLIKLLKEYKWNINESGDINSRFVRIGKADRSYLLLLFGQCKTDAWLADEDDFGNEAPLWFTESTHTLSPIHQINSYIESSAINPDVHQPIMVLIQGAYIINAEDQYENWGKIRIVSFERFKMLISSNGGILDFDTNINDVGQSGGSVSLSTSKEEQPSTDNSDDELDDFDKLLQEFIANELNKCDDESETNIEVDSTEDETDDSDDDPDWDAIPKVKSCKLASLIYDRDDDFPLAGSSTHFRVLEDHSLMIWVEFEKSPPAIFSSENPLSAWIYDESNTLVKKISIDYAPSAPQFWFEHLDLKAGIYWLYLKRKSYQIHAQEFTIVDLPESYTECIELDSFGIYRINHFDENGWEDNDHNTIMKRGSMNCFNRNELSGSLIVCTCTPKTESDTPYEFIISVYNELGQRVFEEAEVGTTYEDCAIVIAKEVRAVVCATGSYTVQIEFLGEIIAQAEFVVGEKDILASYNKQRVQPKSNIAGKGIIKSEIAPMSQLNSMIGLKEVKEKIAGLRAIIKMNENRKAMGLPIKPQMLHCAFLGNPGTGKTTVAKLLGQIYKEIGVLSKGHVVMEERSTLMTQNWGGEGEMVSKAIEKSKGGILFIDEAYDLITEHKSDPGRLIISSLLSAMADEKNRDWMVIFAGYTEPMEKMIATNPGLSSRMTKIYFKDYTFTDLMQIADHWMGRNCYSMSEDALKLFASNVLSAYSARGEHFGNARYINNLLEGEIQPAMARRVIELGDDIDQRTLTTIEREDIPNYISKDKTEGAFDKLGEMVGLSELKNKLLSHLDFVRFLGARRDCNIHTSVPPLHMIFTGNPGTGKSSVADYIGEIYRSMGILSVGNVIKVTRADIIDSEVGGTEKKMKNLLTAAHGNILFIDEAYTLLDKGNSEGSRAMEVLLDSLGREAVDFIVILAGYSREMEGLLQSNPGLKGRFPYKFQFEDYNEDELLQIARSVAGRNSLVLSDEAQTAIAAVIRKEIFQRDSSFSNARFVVRLITTQILPRMASRLQGVTDKEALSLVLAEDVPIDPVSVKMINENLFDEDAIADALASLDSLVGLSKVKSAVHQFVDFARSLNSKGSKIIEDYNLKWSFVGNTGTGKSTVAEILSQILKAMHLLGKGHTIEVKAEEIYGVNTYQADELLKRRMGESVQGLLFIDGDAPQFKSPESRFNPDYLRMCLAANTSEIHGRFAVVIAEHDSPRVELARSLSHIGINDFDHTLIFDDYTPVELLVILNQQLSMLGLSLDDDAAQVMSDYITRLHSNHRSLYANARTIKLLAEAIHKIAEVGSCSNGIITKEVVAEFATSALTVKKIGY